MENQHLWVLRHNLEKIVDHRFHLVREKNIIRIQKKDDLPLARKKTGIRCGNHAPVFLENRYYLVSVTINDMAGVISRTIVNNDDFFHRIGLLKSAINGPGEELFIVIARNNNTRQRKVRWNGGGFFVR